MSEDFRLFLEDMLAYLQGQEAANVKLQQMIKKLLGETKSSRSLPFDASRTIGLQEIGD